nr:PREDICTED: protein D3-like isoform X1 [Bemisia tabaci]XP_018911653.1 PREDICTED: protein D3-like isoform X1 [Bemisia tabaci]XP_018911654.1 PREDICTED: protein D3-like isoform X1 [Bemisia tabaci]
MATSISRKSQAFLVQKRLLPIYTTAIVCNWLTNSVQALFSYHVEFRREADMKKKLLENGLIPDLIEKPPKHAAEFVFLTGTIADFGNKIPPEHLFEEPRAVKFRCEQCELFTILLTDFDAPSRNNPHNREWVHWAVGNCDADNHIDGVQVIAPMIPINPQRGTGFHRYVFYVFKQPNNTRIKFLEPFSNKSDVGRSNFDVKAFARSYGLGDIYALNFFLSEWVPEEKRQPFTDPGPCFE